MSRLVLPADQTLLGDHELLLPFRRIPSGRLARNTGKFAPNFALNSSRMLFAVDYLGDKTRMDAKTSRDPALNAAIKKDRFGGRNGNLLRVIGHQMCPTKHPVYKPGVYTRQAFFSPVAEKSEKPDWAIKIRRLRDDMGLSQGKFGARFEVGGVAVSQWERGVHPPKTENYIKMGNMAPDPKMRLYFWEQAGIDVRVLAETPLPWTGGERRGEKKTG